MGSQTYKHSTSDQTTLLVEDIYLPDMTQCCFCKKIFQVFWILCFMHNYVQVQVSRRVKLSYSAPVIITKYYSLGGLNH